MVGGPPAMVKRTRPLTRPRASPTVRISGTSSSSTRSRNSARASTRGPPGPREALPCTAIRPKSSPSTATAPASVGVKRRSPSPSATPRAETPRRCSSPLSTGRSSLPGDLEAAPTRARSPGNRRRRRPGRPAIGSSVTSTCAPHVAAEGQPAAELDRAAARSARDARSAATALSRSDSTSSPSSRQRWPSSSRSVPAGTLSVATRARGVPLARAEKSRRPPSWPALDEPTQIEAPSCDLQAEQRLRRASARRSARTAWRVPLASRRPPNSSAVSESRWAIPASRRKLASTDWMRGRGASASCWTASEPRASGAATLPETSSERFADRASGGSPTSASSWGRSRALARRASPSTCRATPKRPLAVTWPPGTWMVMPWVWATRGFALARPNTRTVRGARPRMPAAAGEGPGRRAPPIFPTGRRPNRNPPSRVPAASLPQAGRQVAVGREAGEGERGPGLLAAELGGQGQRAAPRRLEAQALDGDGHRIGQVEARTAGPGAGRRSRRSVTSSPSMRPWISSRSKASLEVERDAGRLRPPRPARGCRAGSPPPPARGPRR